MEYQNFELMIVENGIIVISKSHNYDPFIIIHSREMGFKISHCGETAHIYTERIPDIRKSVVYYQNFMVKGNFVLCIPYVLHTLKPEHYLNNIDEVNSTLDDANFPENYYNYKSSAFIIGCPE